MGIFAEALQDTLAQGLPGIELVEESKVDEVEIRLSDHFLNVGVELCNLKAEQVNAQTCY